MLRPLTRLALLALLAGSLFACANDGLDDPSTAEESAQLDGMGTLRVVIHDKPTVEVDQVWLTFDGVSAHHTERGWLDVSHDHVELELLSLRDGLVEDLGLARLPVGHYDQVRLHLTDARVVVDGATYPLDVPSGLQSGVKIVTDFTLEDCTSVLLDLDWDADAHLIHNKQGYKLRPTIKVDALYDDTVCDHRCNGALTFADVRLEQAVRDAARRPTGTLFQRDVDRIDTLYLDNAGLRSLDGLQCLTNLHTLSLANNSIDDLTPIADLLALHTLNLEHNRVADLSPLTRRLPSLEYLYLFDNLVEDTTPLARRCDLTHLDLRSNPVDCDDLTTTRLAACGVDVALTCR